MPCPTELLNQTSSTYILALILGLSGVAILIHGFKNYIFVEDNKVRQETRYLFYNHVRYLFDVNNVNKIHISRNFKSVNEENAKKLSVADTLTINDDIEISCFGFRDVDKLLDLALDQNENVTTTYSTKTFGDMVREFFKW